MPTKVVDGGQIKEWPNKYREELLNSVITGKEIKIDSIVNESSTYPDLDFDIDIFTTEGLEEMQKIKEKNIFELLNMQGDLGRDAIAAIKKTSAYKKYKEYTLEDVIEDDFKRNQLVGFSIFSYVEEKDPETGEPLTDKDDRQIWSPSEIVISDYSLRPTSQVGRIPDLDYQDLILVSFSSKNEIKSERDMLEDLKEQTERDYNAIYKIKDLQKLLEKNLIKYYDNIQYVEDREEQTEQKREKETFSKEKFREQLLRKIAGVINPSLYAKYEIVLEEVLETDTEISAEMTILETQMGRYEIRPFGSPKKFTIRGSVDDKDNFKEWLTSQDPAIKIEGFEEDIGDPKMEDDLDSALDLLFADEVKKERLERELDYEDSPRLKAVHKTIVKQKIKFDKDMKELDSGSKEKRKNIESYRMNRKMDDALQDLEENYVVLEDDIENAIELLGVDD